MSRIVVRVDRVQIALPATFSLEKAQAFEELRGFRLSFISFLR
jgi:hypothetical protein